MPIIPELHPSSAYGKYKNQTTQFITWLVETSKGCGFAISRPNAALTSAKYPIDSHKLVPMAQCLAKSGVSVPYQILRLAQKALDARKDCAKFWTGLPLKDEAIERSNRGHRHFIDIFTQAISILASNVLRKSSVSKSIATGLATPHTDRSLVNLFENLELEEVSDSESPVDVASYPPSSHHTSCSSTSSATSTPVYDIGASQAEERAMAVFGFLTDLNVIRETISAAWSKYADRKMDINTVSALTEISFGLMQSIRGAFLTTYPDMGNYIGILQAACISSEVLSEVGGLSTFECYTLQSYSGLDSRLMLRAYSVLRCLFLDGHILDIRHIDLAGPAGHTTQQQLEQDDLMRDVSALQDLLETLNVYSFNTWVPALDEFTTLLVEFRNAREITLDLVFATSCYLEIQDHMDISTGQASKDLHEIGGNHVQSIGDYLKSLNSTDSKRVIQRTASGKKLASSISGTSENLTEIMDGISGWLSDKECRPRHDQVFNHAKTQRSSKTDVQSKFLSANPLSCGIMSNWISLAMNSMGLLTANNSKSVMCAAHLYSCLRDNDCLATSWEDMETLISLQGSMHMRISETSSDSSTISSALRRFSTITGISIQNFASSRRRPKDMTVSSKEWPKLDDLNPIMRSLRVKYVDRKSLTFTAPLLEALVRNRSSRTEPRGSSAPPSRKPPPPPESSSDYAQLLDRVEHHLFHGRQASLLHFDLLTLHRVSLKLLRHVGHALERPLYRILGLSHSSFDDRQLPVLVMAILIAADKTTTKTTTTSKTNKKGSNNNTGKKRPAAPEILKEAGKIMDAHIAESGNLISVKMRQVLRGRQKAEMMNWAAEVREGRCCGV